MVFRVMKGGVVLVLLVVCVELWFIGFYSFVFRCLFIVYGFVVNKYFVINDKRGNSRGRGSYV